MFDFCDENLKRIISFYGESAQLIVALEELAELQKEITKKIRKKTFSPDDCFVEELADVAIMLEQLIVIFGVDECRLNSFVKYKINRTLEKII